MKAKTLIPLVIGLAVGFFAIKMGMDMVKKAKGTQEDKSMVLVSAKTIDTASAITEQMLAPREVAASLVPPEAFHDRKQLIGRVTKMAIPPGMPITRSMLAPPGATPGLSAQIPAGCRAVSVKVNEETAVAGFINPGSRVDVYAMSTRNTGRGGVRSRLVLSNVEVGAVGQSLNKTGADGKTIQVAKTVTLFLKPEEVQQLNAASSDSRGGLRLALRGTDSDPGESFFAAMFKHKKAKPKAKPAPKAKPKQVAMTAHHVAVQRGSMVEELEFDQFGNVKRVGMRDVNAMPETAPPPAATGMDSAAPVVTELDGTMPPIE